MSQDAKDPKDHHAEEAIVLRNSAPARVSFNEKTGKAQRKRNIFNDDQPGSAGSDETLHEEAGHVLHDDEHLLHVEDTPFIHEEPLQLEPEQTAGTVLRPESGDDATHRLKVEHEDAEDNRLHLPGAEANDSNRLHLPEAAVMDAESLKRGEDITAEHRERLPEQSPSLLPPDLPSLELAAPNVLHVGLSPETPDPTQESARTVAPPPLTPSAAGPAYTPGNSDTSDTSDTSYTSGASPDPMPQSLHQAVPAARRSHHVHLSMDVHQRERLAESMAESVVIEERLHHAQERVIKLTDQILNGNR